MIMAASIDGACCVWGGHRNWRAGTLTRFPQALRVSHDHMHVQQQGGNLAPATSQTLICCCGVILHTLPQVLFLDSDGQCLHNAAEKTGQASPGGLPPDLEAQLEVLEALDDLAELTSALAQSARPDVQGRSFASKPRRPNKSKKRSNKAKGKQR